MRLDIISALIVSGTLGGVFGYLFGYDRAERNTNAKWHEWWLRYVKIRRGGIPDDIQCAVREHG